MAKTYRMDLIKRIINRIMKVLVRGGRGPSSTYILSVKGRKSGKMYSTPVSLIEGGDQRWLVSPYGEVNWVCNARAAKRVNVERGGKSKDLGIEEVGPKESAPILKKYLAQEGIPRPYFDVAPDSPIDAYEQEAPRHPVSRLVPIV